MKNGWYVNLNHLGAVSHYVNNKLHNEKNPAIIWKNGSKDWCQNNERHRLDGPASEWSNGEKYWYYQGERIDCQTQKEFERIIKLKILW